MNRLKTRSRMAPRAATPADAGSCDALRSTARRSRAPRSRCWRRSDWDRISRRLRCRRLAQTRHAPSTAVAASAPRPGRRPRKSQHPGTNRFGLSSRGECLLLASDRQCRRGARGRVDTGDRPSGWKARGGDVPLCQRARCRVRLVAGDADAGGCGRGYEGESSTQTVRRMAATTQNTMSPQQPRPTSRWNCS